MVTVEEAEGIIFSNPFPKRTIVVPVANTGGRTLAQAIYADRDFPPFDRVAMDGIAIAYSAYLGGQRDFTVEALHAAGQPSMKLKDPGNCIEVMTGAVLPEGTDTVIRYEDISLAAGAATVHAAVAKGQNIHTRSADAHAGEVLLEPGTLISPAEVALLASVGIDNVPVFGYPETAIISSGDELVDINDTPEAHQIRRSNVYALESAMREMHWSASRHHFPDDEVVLRSQLAIIADKTDVLILSGGVSKGKFDFIPRVLESLGMEKKFHQVLQRPGKPFWFGVSPAGKTVFALPGNPVSTYMCFYRYIRPWMRKSFGIIDDSRHAILATDLNKPLPLTHFLQVDVRNEQGRMMAYPAAGGGSGDFANLKRVTGFLELPPSNTGFTAGAVFPYIPFRRG